jgi:hypothetical protein
MQDVIQFSLLSMMIVEITTKDLVERIKVVKR